MKGELKPFDQELYNKNDPKSRRYVKELFKTINITLNDGRDKYDIDLVSDPINLESEFLVNYRLFVEVENKPKWFNKWPYPVVHFAERKKKNFDRYPGLFVLTSDNGNNFAITSSKELREYFKKEPPIIENEYSKNERFWRMSKNDYVWILNGQWFYRGELL
jgi:hypothetical protein